uniref:Uncharacterized protein n=1 Tax=Daphnia galeata TaxID=27404 RepID=A0A8J2WG35_9CRUS|nr:unnamed protein product [Daphnia galeata]
MTSTKTNEKAQKEDDFDVDDLLTQLSAEELEMLSKEVDPDVRKFIYDQFVPPDQRTNYHCERKDTGKMDKKHLNDHISKIALETPDQPENVPFSEKHYNRNGTVFHRSTVSEKPPYSEKMTWFDPVINEATLHRSQRFCVL